MVNSASIVTACWGTRYQPYIARWWQSLKTLNTMPNEIVLVTDLSDPCNLLTSVPDWVDVPVVKVQVDSDDYNTLWKAGVHGATQEWLVKMPIDDQFLPEALDFLDKVDGDLVIDRCKFLQGGEWPAIWDTSATHSRKFAPAGFSPFRRNLVAVYDSMPMPCPWDDYLFYLMLAKADVKVWHTDAYRMLHDLGDDHETVSGNKRNQEKASQADARLQEIRQELGL